MKFLLDQNLSPQTTQFLRQLGITVIDVREVGLDGKSDQEIYDYALLNKLVIITFDHEFGYTYLARKDLEALVILRLHPQTKERIHRLLEQFFAKIDEQKTRKSIVVIERHRVRIRKVERNGG